MELVVYDSGILKKNVQTTNINISSDNTSVYFVAPPLAVYSTGTGSSVVNYVSGHDLYLKSLSGGNGMSVVPNITEITFNNTLSMQPTSSTGVSIISSGSAPSFALKTLLGSTYINITDNITHVVVSANASNLISNLTSAGGSSLVYNATGPNLSIKGIVANSGIGIIDNSSHLLIYNTLSNATNVLNSVGTGVTLVNTSIGPNFAIKSLTAGGGVVITSTTTEVTISSSGNTTAYGHTYFHGGDTTDTLDSPTGVATDMSDIFNLNTTYRYNISSGFTADKFRLIPNFTGKILVEFYITFEAQMVNYNFWISKNDSSVVNGLRNRHFSASTLTRSYIVQITGYIDVVPADIIKVYFTRSSGPSNIVYMVSLRADRMS